MIVPVPTSGIYATYMSSFFGNLTASAQTTLWDQYLQLNGFQSSPSANNMTAQADFIHFAQGILNNQQSLILSPDEIQKRDVMLATFDTLLNMLLTLQNTIGVQGQNLIFYGNLQQQMTNQLTRVPVYVGGTSSLPSLSASTVITAANLNVNPPVAGTDLSQITFGYNNISLQDIANWWAENETNGVATQFTLTNGTATSAPTSTITFATSGVSASQITPANTVPESAVAADIGDLSSTSAFILTTGTNGVSVNIPVGPTPIQQETETTENTIIQPQTLQTSITPIFSGNSYTQNLQNAETAIAAWWNQTTASYSSSLQGGFTVADPDGQNDAPTFFDLDPNALAGTTFTTITAPLTGELSFTITIPPSTTPVPAVAVPSPNFTNNGVAYIEPASTTPVNITQQLLFGVGNTVTSTNDVSLTDAPAGGSVPSTLDTRPTITWQDPFVVPAGTDTTTTPGSTEATDADMASKARAEINARDQQYIQNITAQRETVSNISNQLETNLSSSKDAVSQTSDLLSSIMDGLNSIISSIFR